MTEWISAFRDVALAVAGVVTATVAVRGLQTWNRQLRGTADFEVARALAKSSYSVRDTLQDCRSPFISAGEFPPEWHEAGLHRTPAVEAKGYAFVFTKRWSPVWNAMQQFDANLLEAEALWGEPIRTATDSLRKIVREVNVAIDAMIEDAASGGENFSSDRDFGRKMRGRVSASRTDADNEINRRLADAIRTIEEHLRPHLRRS